MKERLLALDVFRGATVAAMLLVNNPGNWGALYPPVAHAAWNGWTPTDLIFPFFLFMVGITTHLSLEARRARGDDERQIVKQIFRRAALIVLAGLILHAFPFWPLERIPAIRLPGVLQRIGVAYLFAALLTRRTSVKQQVAICVALLYGYWFAMTLLPVPGQEGIGALLLNDPPRTLAAWTDRLFLDGHLWRTTKTWDPEGVLSTVPAIGTVILGVLTGRWLGQAKPLAERLNGMFAAGAIAMMLGLMWHWSFPINKSLWTSSYVLFTAGMGAVVLAVILWITDVHGYKKWTWSFVQFGINPIVAFVGSGMMARTISSLIKVPVEGGNPIGLQTWIYRNAFATWLEPKNASLAFAICFVLTWLLILALLNRKGWILKL